MQHLHFNQFGKTDLPPMIIIHGLFGSSDNWISVAKELGNNFHVYAVDARNHGKSFHDPEFDYDVMSDDLERFITHQNLQHSIVVGHSMGGKIAMKYAVKYPTQLSKLVVIDISPRFYPIRHEAIINAFYSVPLDSIKSRNEADKILSESIQDFGIRQFLLKNLKRDGQNKFSWKINLDVIKDNIEKVGKGLEHNEIFEGPTLFIGGKKSDYIQNEDNKTINHHFPNSKVVMIDDAGHWVHAEKPEELIQTILYFAQS